MIFDEPTEITIEDIDRCFERLLHSEITKHECFKCMKKYMHSYGHNFSECDECYFSRFPKKEVEDFCRSFFE